MKKKIVVKVEMEFEVDGEKEAIKESIGEQITSDMNVYWQNDDDTAQMTEIKSIALKYGGR